MSRPTEKQLLSLLKAADSDTGPVESSMTCRVFIVAPMRALADAARMTCTLQFVASQGVAAGTDRRCDGVTAWRSY